MQKTTSIFQSFDLTNYTDSDNALIVRPPQSLRAFRCTIFVTSQLDLRIAAAAYIANFSGANELSAIMLNNYTEANTNTGTPPSLDTTIGVYQLDRIVLDRRGVGYMADTFYVWDAIGTGSSAICFIWEGEID
jgi:hypothetical protein